MKAKKDKSLVLELIDDLLSDHEEDSSDNQGADNSDVSSDIDSQPLFSDEVGDSIAKSEDGSVSEGGVLELDLGGDEPSSPKEPKGHNEETIQLGESHIAHTVEQVAEKQNVPPPKTVDHSTRSHIGVKSKLGRMFSGGRANAAPMGPAEASLAQSESLRIAQQKIIDLEKEMERLRIQNEELGAAGDTLRKRADELLARAERAESQYSQNKESFQEEKNLLIDSINSKSREVDQQRAKTDELEMRLSTNIQKVRVRERELENRLELVKMEGSAVVRSKDELILDLKRQMDQLNHELDNYRGKNQELNKRLSGKQEMLRRTVKALRLALSMLEGDEGEALLKKVK